MKTFIKNKKVLYWTIATSLLVCMFVLSFSSALRESQTVDEAVHLSTGYQYLVERDYTLNPEHPPLMKMVSAFPLLFTDVSLPKEAYWKDNHGQWWLGREFMYSNDLPGGTILALGRIPNMFIGILLGLAILTVVTRFFGRRAGLFALFFYSFDPLFLAHSHYVTTDVGLALFFFLSVYCFGRYLMEQNQRLLWFAGLFFGLAQATKFSAVILLPIFIILFFIAWWQARSTDFFTWKKCLSTFSLIAGITIAVLFASYGFEVGTYHSIPTLFPTYFEGIEIVARHNAQGHFSFLFGEFSTSGWWWYFPASWFVKTPLATVLLVCLVLLFWCKQGLIRFLAIRNKKTFYRSALLFFKELPFLVYLLVLPPLLYLLWSMTSHINLGVRHIALVYPFVFVYISTLTLLIFKKLQKVWNIILIFFALVYVVSTVSMFPYFISYFSEAVGGAPEGYKYLRDSNVDWGQSMKYVQAYIEENDVDSEDVYTAFLSSTPIEYYGITAKPFPDELRNLSSIAEIPPGVYFYGVSYDLTSDLDFQFFLDMEPDAILGHAVFVYDFR